MIIFFCLFIIHLMSFEDKLQFIEKIQNIPSMPTIILDLMAMLNDQKTTTNELVKKIRVDQGLISHILKCCNSPLFGVRKEINSVGQAINLLGYLNLKSILTTYFVGNLYGASGKNECMQYLWHHSVAVAVFAKETARFLQFRDDEIYLGGLLHDLGKLIMYKHDSHKYDLVYMDFKDRQKPMIESESQAFEFTHVEAGIYLMQKWGFSEFLKETVQLHHGFEDYWGGLDIKYAIVPFANLLVHNVFDQTEHDLSFYKSLLRLDDTNIHDFKEDFVPLVNDFVTAR